MAVPAKLFKEVRVLLEALWGKTKEQGAHQNSYRHFHCLLRKCDGGIVSQGECYMDDPSKGSDD